MHVELSLEMHDHATFDLDRCREKDFVELLRFIEESLARLSDPDPGGERPHSLEEFRHLVQMLRELDDVLPVAPVPMLYEPSRKLTDKRDKLKRLNELLLTSYGEPHTRKRDIRQMLDRQPELKREIAELEASERADHAARLAAYQRYSNRTRTRAVNRINKAVERAFKPQPTGRMQWRPLPPGEATPEKVRRYYRERLQREGRLDKFDEARLDTATDLPYEKWWVPTEGFGGFDAYSILTFTHNKVLLECPIYGNAAFVISAAEEVWREMTKQELVDSGLAERIPHQGENWPVKVRQALDLE